MTARVTENFAYLGGQRVALLVSCERLAVFRLERHCAFERNEATNFSTAAERT